MTPVGKIPGKFLHLLLRYCFFITIAIAATVISSCQQSSEESSVSGSTDRSAPTTTVTASSFCTLNGLTVSGCTYSPIEITFTADETATIYYAQGDSAGVPVTTESESVSSGESISVTGTEGSTVYVAFFARDTSNNDESIRELTISIPDLTSPVVSIAYDSTACSYDSAASENICEGPVTIALECDDATACTIYYELTTETASTPDTSSTQYTGPFSVSANDSYLSFYAVDSAGNEASMMSRYFEIAGIYPSINGGYYGVTQDFTLSLSANRNLTEYQLYYLERSGTDVSTDSTSDADTVFSSGSSPTANSSAVRYLNTYEAVPGLIDTNAETITAAPTAGDTEIYQYKYNLIHSGTQDATGDVQNGSVDKEGSLVLYIDRDIPKAVAVPPSSGSLSSTMTIYFPMQDSGHDKVETYASSNPNLSTATPLQSPTVTYCKSTTYLIEDAVFWNYCLYQDPRLGFASGGSITLDSDTRIGFTGKDAADNGITCRDHDIYKQYTCEEDPYYSETPHFSEKYTPGMQQTWYYHDNETHFSNTNLNFGHAVAIGDLDGNGTDDIAIGAPAYAHSAGGATIENGAVYIWYNGFRERALLPLIDNDAVTDISNHAMTFSTDGFNPLTIYLDPATDTSGDSSDKFQALSGDYSDKTQATATEIATVLNKGFLSSFGKDYQNYLYAHARTDGKLSIGHVNQTIQGYFTYSSTFDATSDFYYSGSAIRAYDYAIFGENAGDEFGYTLAIAQVDTSTDTATYSSKQLIIGAPGFDSNNGALYVVRMPATDASADYGTVTLSDSTSDAYKVYATTGTGRLGHAIVTYDNNGDSYGDIYVSAPYYNGLHSNGGAVYKINQNAFTYSDASNDVSADAASNYVWNGVNEDGADADNALFGFSLVAGRTEYPPTNSNSRYLFVGIPGLEDGSNRTGLVAYFDIRSLASPLASQPLFFYEDQDEVSQTYFGYSLAIVNEGFDTNGEKCPCLVVGAPNAESGKGKVWILGKGGYAQSLSGSSTSDRLGVNLVAGKIGASDTFDTLFVTARSTQHKGQIVIVRKQALAVGTDITAEPLSSDLKGSNNGDNLGHGMAVISVNGVKALLLGLAGETTTPNSPYYQFGEHYNQKGSIRVYSGSRLGY